MKKHGNTIKPRDTAALALARCKGGVHQKSVSALRQHDRRQLRQELAAMGRSRNKGSQEPFLFA